MLIAPGFVPTLWDSVLTILQRRSTNLPLPVPWPWQLDFSTGWHWDIWGMLGVSLSFVLAPAAIVLAGWAGWAGDRASLAQRSLLCAASATGLFFLHHAFGRADAPHIAQAIHPALLCGLALSAMPWIRRLQPFLVCAAAGAMVFFGVLGIHRHPASVLWTHTVEFDVAGDSLRIPQSKAKSLRGVLDAADSLFLEDPVYIVNAPLIYATLGKRAPSHSLFITWELSDEEQETIINDLEAGSIKWILIFDVAFDGREELRFEHTHARVWKWAQLNFEPVPDAALSPPYQLWRRKLAVQR